MNILELLAASAVHGAIRMARKVRCIHPSIRAGVSQNGGAPSGVDNT